MRRIREHVAGLRGRLVTRAVVASMLLAVLVGVAFTALLIAVDSLRSDGKRATATRNTLATADILERLVIDLETGQRGFIITRQERFLQPWRAARIAAPVTARRLIRLSDPGQQRLRARQIARQIGAYVRDYSEPLVDAARRNDPRTRTAATTAQGKRRVDAIRALFKQFTTAEGELLDRRQAQDDRAARRAVAAAAVGLGGSVLLILLLGGYLVRAIVLPIRRISTAADRLAGGDLGVRTPETGIAEIGGLERSFNAMGASLETGRDALREIVDEQAALRRVATLVARGVPPDEVLQSVVTEAADLLGTTLTSMLRFEPDGEVVLVAGPERIFGVAPLYLSADGDSVTASVRRTGKPARMDIDEYTGPFGARMREHGITAAAAAPIVVEGQVWGAMTATWDSERRPADHVEVRMAQFTELLATAISNAESRAELTASRARVVEAGDETRRRIEQDLHDGAQQRLVHTVITLKLAQRALPDGEGDAARLVDEALEHADRAYAELRELAHGILPPVLTRGGLRAAVAALASELPIPVSISIPGERLREPVEATAYFIVNEALTNVLKHAHAEHVEVNGTLTGDTLTLEIRDDGVGGARIQNSNGLLGLRDRASALGGQLRVDSPRGGGTTLVATLPVGEGLQAL